MSPQKLTMSIRASLRSRHTKLHSDFEHIPHKSNNTLPSQHPAKPFRLKHPTSLNTTSLAAPRTNQIFKAANKELSLLCFVKAKSHNSFVCLKTIVLSSKSYICIFFSDYNLIQRWSAELIYLKNNPCLIRKFIRRNRGDIIGIFISGRGSKKNAIFWYHRWLYVFNKDYLIWATGR